VGTWDGRQEISAVMTLMRVLGREKKNFNSRNRVHVNNNKGTRGSFNKAFNKENIKHVTK
jgi:hypothetical protein